MARQYYVTPRVGSGTDDDFFRPKVPAGVNYVAACNESRCLVLAAGALQDLDSDGEADALFGVDLDRRVSTFSAAVRNRVLNRLDTLGIGRGDLTNQSTVRDVVNHIGRFFDPNFTVERFWVSD